MSSKERLVDGDIFDTHNPLILFIFQNSIDQEKGIPMGQKIHDLLDFQAADGFAHSIHFTLHFFFPE
jgi:hypothetical protein